MPLKAVAIMGATGTGKSALAMELAAKHGLCIMSCDSMQLYRKLDIGTAKPSPNEQQLVRHALIDCSDITETWNAQRWATAARHIIQQENEQGKIPLIVGGTGMYLRALREGFAEVPPEKDGVRTQLTLLQAEYGTPYLHEKLQHVDPILTSRLERHDSQRIMRGLAVFESTGIPLSTWHSKQEESQRQTRESIECPVFVLEMERELLRERLAIRFQQMMQQGWLEEVQWLQQQHLADTHPVMRAVGYRQLLNHCNGLCTLDQAITEGITATRRYAKRQSTWFRNQTKSATRASIAELKHHLEAHLKAN